MPVQPVRKLGIPNHGSRAWRVPAMLYWDRQRLKQLDDIHAGYSRCDSYKRRRRNIERRIARLEAEFRAIHEGAAL